MQHSSSRAFAGPSSGVRCPHCSKRAHRMRRRWIDRILSLFTPVRRYWCYECHWQGNLDAEHAQPFNPGDSWAAMHARAALRRAAQRSSAAAPAVGSTAAVPRPRALAVVARGFGQPTDDEAPARRPLRAIGGR